MRGDLLDARASSSGQRHRGILIVDDDDGVRRAFVRALRSHGWRVVDCGTVAEAMATLDRGFDVVVSDVALPGASGIDLLKQVREHDLDLPVILVTGQPAIETAAAAVDYGAYRYFTKPVDIGSLLEAVEQAAKYRELAQAKRQAMEAIGVTNALAADRAGVEAQLKRALEGLWIAYQPIVRPPSGEIVAFEALMRSEEPSLPHPGAVLEAAERLDAVAALGRIVRARAVEPFDRMPPEALLFVNLHPSELEDPWLADPNAPLGSRASRVVLEITERATLDSVSNVQARIAALRELGYRIAVDDLGAGYAGLSSFAQLEPEFVKLDMSLIRNVHTSRTRQLVIRSLTALCADLGMQVVAEGVETAEERDAVVELGCDLLQGYHFARPGRAFPSASW